MAGCGSSACGIQKGRDKELASARRAASLATSSTRPSGGPALEDLRAFGEQLEDLLPLRALVRPAESAQSCDWLYLLAGVHPRSLVEIADGLLAPLVVPFRTEESYLRLGFSALGPFVTLQEVRVSLQHPEETSERPKLFENLSVILEEPKAGVEDPRLRFLVKGIQGALRKRRWIVLDAAFLVQDDAILWHRLFDPNPFTTARLTPAR